MWENAFLNHESNIKYFRAIRKGVWSTFSTGTWEAAILNNEILLRINKSTTIENKTSYETGTVTNRYRIP